MRQLHQKKFRNEHRLFIVEGKKMVEEAISSTYLVKSLYSTDEKFVLQHHNCSLITEREMNSISLLSSASQHLAVVHQSQMSTDEINDNFILVLDGIADPGNLGTIIRTADWFGFATIICSDDCVDLHNPKVVQSTMGSIFRMRILYQSHHEVKSTLSVNNFQIIGADLNGKNLFQYAFPNKTAMVIGSESHGIREAMQAILDDKITIVKSGKAESLNASVAAGIICAEWAKGNVQIIPM